MYHIAVLTDGKDRSRLLSRRIRQIGAEYGSYPVVEEHDDQEQFFIAVQRQVPDGVFLDLPGVAGLNAAEHLHALCPDCRIIWCSDLDFSLQAYRLRAEYFILRPIEETELRSSLSLWFEKSGRPFRGCRTHDPIKPVVANFNKVVSSNL